MKDDKRYYQVETKIASPKKPEYPPFKSWVIGFFLIIGIWLGLTVVATLFFSTVAVIFGISLEPTRYTVFTPSLRFILINFNFIFLALGIFIILKFYLKVPLTPFVTDKPKFQWKKLLCYGSLWIALTIVATIIKYVLRPEDFSSVLTEGWAERLILLPFILVLTPLQTMSEELFSRAYIARMGGKTLPSGLASQLIYSTISGLVFMSLHITNPELSSGVIAALLYYFLFGAFLMYLSLRTGGFEAAIGIHAMHNLFIALIVNYSGTTLPTVPLFLRINSFGNWWAVVELICFITAMLLILQVKAKRELSCLSDLNSVLVSECSDNNHDEID